MHLECVYEKVKRKVIDSNLQKEIKTAEDAEKVIAESVNKMEEMVEEYREELQVIYDVCSKFAYVLINNSTTVSLIHQK